jgi:hypothetical protein
MILELIAGCQLGRIDQGPVRIVVIEAGNRSEGETLKKKVLACSRGQDGGNPFPCQHRRLRKWGRCAQGPSSPVNQVRSPGCVTSRCVACVCSLRLPGRNSLCSNIPARSRIQFSVTRASWRPSALLPGYPRPLSKSWGRFRMSLRGG